MVTRTTTLAAFAALKPEGLKLEVLEFIETAGMRGVIGDQVRAHFSGRGHKDGSINTRFSELERDHLICRLGDTRVGASGRQQLILRAAEFGPPGAGTTAAIKRTGFLAGLMYAAKIVATSADMPTVRSKLKAELIKTASRGKCHEA